MLTILLWAMPWMADPNLTDPAGANGTMAVATCSRPSAKATQPSTVTALSPIEITDAIAVEGILRHWEGSSLSNSEWSRSQREVFRQRMKKHFNEHSLAVTEQLSGRVTRDWLCETFDWRIIDRSPEHVCLEAIPRDETERLFYASIRVWLNVDRCVPEQIIIVNRSQEHRLAWRSEGSIKSNTIQLVHFEDNVPPAPRAVVKTADARAD